MKLCVIFFEVPLIHDCPPSIFNMLRHLTDYFDIEIVCPVLSGKPVGYEVSILKTKVHYLHGWKNGKDLYFRKFLSVTTRILKIFSSKSKSWDAVLIIDPDPLSQFAFLMARLCRLPRILYLRGNDLFETMNRNRQGWRNLLARIWCRWLNFAIPRMLKDSLGIVTGKALYEKYNKFQPDLITLYASSVTERELKARISEKKTSNNNRLNLIMVGNLIDYKGVDLALKAVKDLIKKGLNVKIDIVGTGPEEKRLKLLAEELGIGDSVSFSGFIPYGEELFKHYNEANAILLPSKTEGTPKVIPEAFSFGLPVIATNVGGIPDMVIDGYNGFLIGVDEIIYLEFSAVLEQIIKSKGLLEKLSKGAFASASDYTVEVQLSRVSEAIKRKVC